MAFSRQVMPASLRTAPDVRFQFSQFRLQQVRRQVTGAPPSSTRACNAAFLPAPGCGVFAFSEYRRFLWQWFCLAFAGQDVVTPRVPFNLCGWGVTSGIKRVSRGFPPALVEFVAAFLLLLQLAFEVGEHSARYTGHQNTAVVALQLAFKGVVLLRTSRKYAAMLSPASGYPARCRAQYLPTSPPALRWPGCGVALMERKSPCVHAVNTRTR